MSHHLLHPQGDTVATRFYVLERGTAQVYQRREEWGEEERRVHEYAPGRCVWSQAVARQGVRTRAAALYSPPPTPPCRRALLPPHPRTAALASWHCFTLRPARPQCAPPP